MIDISSRVYSNLVGDKTLQKYLKGSGTTKNDKPPAFPYMYVKTLGEPTTSASLQNDQCAIKASFEITVYDSKSSTTAKQLIFHVAELMRQMGFTTNYGPTEIDRSSTTEAYRWLARFRRTLALAIHYKTTGPSWRWFYFFTYF